MRGAAAQRVVVSVGASGIGAATTARFLEEDARFAVPDRSDKAPQRIRTALPALDLALHADIADAESVRAAFEQIDRVKGEFDVLINNAGISLLHPSLEITPETWREVIDVTLIGIFLIGQAATRRMLVGNGGAP